MSGRVVSFGSPQVVPASSPQPALNWDRASVVARLRDRLASLDADQLAAVEVLVATIQRANGGLR